MSELNFAAVDLGAESGRVVVGNFDGQRLSLEEVHRFLNLPSRAGTSAGSTLQWDVLRLWNDIQDGLAKVVSSHANQLAGIGVDTWGVDFGLLDETGALLGNPTHYRDSRTDGMMELAFQTVPQREIFERTGLQFMPFNTLFQLLALKQQNSPQLEIAQSLLFLPDLLHFWLTGVKSGEYTIASTSQMLDARTRSWDNELLRKLDLPTNLLPNLVAPGTTLGPLRSEIAARTGLDASTRVVVPGSHDTASAIAAVPAQGDNWAVLSSGTWSIMGVELDEPLITDRTFELNFTNEGGVGGKIRFLKNIAGLWLVQECRRTWLRAGAEYSYSELTERAAQSKPFSAIVEPNDFNFAAPQNMPNAIAEYCARSGQQAPHSEGAFVRCCLESLALKYRWTLEKLEELRGGRIEVLHIVGGGTQNRLLSQLTADCIGRPVVAGPVEATAIGNILTQAKARGELSTLQDIRDVVRHSFEVETFLPNSATASQWEAAYEKFLTFDH